MSFVNSKSSHKSLKVAEPNPAWLSKSVIIYVAYTSLLTNCISGSLDLGISEHCVYHILSVLLLLLFSLFDMSFLPSTPTNPTHSLRLRSDVSSRSYSTMLISVSSTYALGWPLIQSRLPVMTQLILKGDNCENKPWMICAEYNQMHFVDLQWILIHRPKMKKPSSMFQYSNLKYIQAVKDEAFECHCSDLTLVFDGIYHWNKNSAASEVTLISLFLSQGLFFFSIRSVKVIHLFFIFTQQCQWILSSNGIFSSKDHHIFRLSLFIA